jgi:uncharacterized RDD family membrane protein YckC/Tfp pilus assembly major pilin PilA
MHKEVSWYFVDLLGQRKGPVTQQQLLDAVADDRIRPASLVWREGLAQWQPYSTMAHELHHRGDSVPPPAPVGPPAYVETNPFATSPSSFVNDWTYAALSNEVAYGGFGRRLAALMLDSLILSFITAVPMAILLPMVAKPAAGHTSTSAVLWLYLAMLVVSMLYWSLQESSSHQATFGKRALGIKVAGLDGKRIGWGRAVARWFARMLSGFFFCLGYLVALFTSRKQALHDLLVSTVVVDQWAYTNHPERQKHGGGAALAAIVVLVVFLGIAGILAAIAIPQYQMYVMRSQVMGAYNSAEALRPALIEAYRREQRCPVNGEAGLQEPEAYAAPFVAAITIGTSGDDAGQCTLGVVLRSTNLAINDKHLWLSTAPASGTPGWTCRSDLPEKYLPMQCR